MGVDCWSFGLLNILVIEDDPSILVTVGDALRSRRHQIVTAADGAEALVQLRLRAFDVVLCDVRLPKIDGLTVLKEFRMKSPTTDFILMTAYARVPDAVVALKEGATDYLTKPFSIDELLLRIDRIGRERQLKGELTYTRRWTDRANDSELIGRSPAMLCLHERLEKFALSDAPVLITGESGTGKELVAAALHKRSPRGDKPFIAVNCAAFPETLFEAELFGHERGAFTGAMKRREGRFKAADGGTLFLDEVAEMPLPSQAKILRVIQEQSFEPLGTNQKLTVDVRVLSATHRNLKEWVSQGRFREDLYYRLKILELQIPPLRERKSDIPTLIEYFLRRFSSRAKPITVSNQALAAMTEYPYPGNVRELEHAVRHGCVLAGAANEIDLSHLPGDVTGTFGHSVAPPGESILPLLVAVRDFEREYLKRAIKFCDGSKTRTAQALGISRKNLWEKLRRHGLVGEESDEETTGPNGTPLTKS